MIFWSLTGQLSITYLVVANYFWLLAVKNCWIDCTTLKKPPTASKGLIAKLTLNCSRTSFFDRFVANPKFLLLLWPIWIIWTPLAAKFLELHHIEIELFKQHRNIFQKNLVYDCSKRLFFCCYLANYNVLNSFGSLNHTKLKLKISN